MSVSINLSITSSAGKKSSKAYTDINPDASNTELNQFANSINQLTSNTLTSVSKITKEEISGNTYYDVAIAFSEESGDASMLPTRVDDTHFTFDAATFISSATSANVFKFQYFAATLSANNVSIDQYCNHYIESNYVYPSINAAFPRKASGVLAGSQAMILFANDLTVTELKNCSFRIIIPSGNNGDLYWNATTFNFSFI